MRALLETRPVAALGTLHRADPARFPDAAATFELGDFSIVAPQPVSAPLVAGFGRAYGLVGDSLVD